MRPWGGPGGGSRGRVRDKVFAERDILTFTDNPFVVSLYCSFETKVGPGGETMGGPGGDIMGRGSWGGYETGCSLRGTY